MTLRTILPLLCTALAAGFAPAALGQNGPAYYLDVNGTSPGFGDPDGLTIDWTETDWSTDPTGIAALGALPNWYDGSNFHASQLVFGYPGTTGISNSTFTVTANGPMIAGVTFNVPCTVNLASFNIFSFLAQETWSVPTGSTFNITASEGNWAFTTVTMEGGGTVDFNCPDVGRNAGLFVQNMTNGTVNLMQSYTAVDNASAASYELLNGTLNLAVPDGIGGTAQPKSPPQYLNLSGGTLDNISGGAMTLDLGPAVLQIGGSFGFAGSSSLNFGASPVDLGTVTPTITVSNNTLEFDGPLTNTAGLTVAGPGTLLLTAANTYSGNTTVSGGTLTLSGGGSISNSPIISIAAGATFDVSGLTATATLGSRKTLQAGGSTSSATLATAAGKGLTLSSTSPLQFTAFKPAGSGGAVPLALSGAGTLALGVDTPVTITVANGGTALTAAGSPYKLIAKSASGTVTTLPGGPLTVNGDGNNGTVSLSVSNGELYLVVTGSSVPTSTKLAIIAGSPVYGNNNLTFTATVTTNGVTAGNATGNFVFSVDGIVVATNALSTGSASLRTGSLTVGSHQITASYSGDVNYNSSAFTLVQSVNPLAVGLAGARAYDGTSNAAHGVLTITNVVGNDNVYPASGSVELAGSTVGEQAIASPATLTLGGAQAVNYTVTGLTGSVLITNGTSLLLTSSSQTNAYQIPVAFGATVLANGSAVNTTGSVTFLTNGVAFYTTNLVNGTADSPYIADLPPGVNTITAQYTGDGNYSGSTNTLEQVVMQQTSNMTFSNSLVAITFNPSGVITTIVRKDTGENKNYDSQGFYLWNEQSQAMIKFSSMVEIASNVVLLSTADGHYNVTFQVTCQNRYLKFGLLNVSDCPSGGIDTNWIGWSVAFQCYPFPYNGQTNDGWQIYALGLDPMEDILSTVNPIYALWPYVQYSQANAYAYPYDKLNSQTASNFPLQPMGALAIFTANSAAQHDDILYDIWSGEPSLPEPNRASLTNGWNRAAAQAWMTRWESELPPTKLLYLVPNNLSDLYNAANIMYANGLNGLYIFDYYWKGQAAVDSINTTLFPNGLSDVTAFERYCAARGISLYFHWSSVFVNYSDPLYGAMSPTGVSPDLARWATDTLLTSINSSSTSFNVQPEPGCQLIVAPPPWGNYDLGSAVPLSDSYPPYYPAWFTPIMNISNDLMFASVTMANPTNWLISGVNRSSPTSVSQFGNSWGESHAAGSRVDFLLSEGGSFIPDSRSVLFTNLAVRYATLMNEENIAEADYDSLEQNQDLGNWGPRRESQALFEALDHPVHANSSFGSAPWGHFEYNFDSVQQQDGGPGYRLENAPAAEVRLWDPSLMATHLDEDQFSLGVQASYSPNLSIGGYHVGTTVNTITNQGWWSQVVANLNMWQSLAPYLTTNEQTALRSFGSDFYVPSQSGSGWELTPTRAMLRDGIDTSWQLMTESGPISPHQFMQVGDTLNSLTNPYTAQTPQIEMLVLPSMAATNPNNVSLLPSGAVTFTTTVPYNWNLSPVNMSQSRGIAITVTGDGSGSDLVLNIGGRYYVVTVNFTGTKTIEIPNGEVEIYRSSATGYSWVNSGQIGTFNYSAVGNFSLFLGYVPNGVTPNIQVSSITTMHENQTIGLVNPTLTLNGNNATITGTIPYNDYVVYSGGSTASVYDANWNFLATLPASGATLTAINGLNSFSVSAPGSPNTWMATRVKVNGAPWVFSKPAPIHEWRFENNANDTAGTANGTTINGPVYVPGIEGTAALAFNGASQYVNVPNVSDMQFTSAQSFTISAWVKLNSLPNTATTILGKDSTAGAWYGLGITAANQWTFGGATNLVSPTVADIGQWHLIAGVQNATDGTRKLYVDGRLVAAGIAQDGSGTGAIRMAALPGTTPTQFLYGTMDDARIYNQALAATDISLLATNLASAGNSIITESVNAGQLVLNWPANQLWQLQVQTNSLGVGLTTNWFNLTGATPPYTVNIAPAQPSVFYRLTHP